MENRLKVTGLSVTSGSERNRGEKGKKITGKQN